MDVIRGLLWVAFGSVFGGMMRFWVSGAVARRVGETFPWGTIIVNVSGAFAIGVLGGMASTGQGIFAAPSPWLFAVTGFLGCYTTVSSFVCAPTSTGAARIPASRSAIPSGATRPMASSL